MVVIAIFAIDTLVSLLQKVEIESWDSVDSEYVYEMSSERIKTKANRYLEVLNREDANAGVDYFTLDSFESASQQEDSIYETKGSDFNAAEEVQSN